MAEYYTTFWNLPAWKCNTSTIVSFIDMTAVRKTIFCYLREKEVPFPLPDVWIYGKRNLLIRHTHTYIYIHTHTHTHTHTHKVVPRHTTRILFAWVLPLFATACGV